eukprot:2836862-Rhodomonas_salina.1
MALLDACEGRMDGVNSVRDSRAELRGGGAYLDGAQLEVGGELLAVTNNSAGLQPRNVSTRDSEAGSPICGVRECGMLGARVQGSGFRSGFRVQGSGLRVQASGFRLQGLGFKGGGLFFSTHVRVEASETLFEHNRAGEEGGGLCGSGWRAELTVLAARRLKLVGNEAGDGGGVALLALARLAVAPDMCGSSSSCVRRFAISHAPSTGFVRVVWSQMSRAVPAVGG